MKLRVVLVAACVLVGCSLLGQAISNAKVDCVYGVNGWDCTVVADGNITEDVCWKVTTNCDDGTVLSSYACASATPDGEEIFLSDTEAQTGYPAKTRALGAVCDAKITVTEKLAPKDMPSD